MQRLNLCLLCSQEDSLRLSTWEAQVHDDQCIKIKGSLKNLLKPLSQFSMVAGYKVNV